jgi:hypothetical protein
VNGHDIKYEVKHFWTDVPVPIDYLQIGENIVTVRTLEKDTQFKTWVALDENYRIGSKKRLHHPNRSARSVDNGITWDFEHLGEKGLVDGEYPIRLKLSAYHSSGGLQSPIIDMAANSNLDGIRQAVIIDKANIKLEEQISENTQIKIEARSGSTHFFSENTWEDWQLCQERQIPESLLTNRFLQFRLHFITMSPAVSPLLKKIKLEMQYKAKSERISQGIEVVMSINKPKILTSYDFSYENPKHPKLTEFRKKYNLDAVVQGCENEFETILRLQNWVSRQWHWRLLEPDEEINEWSALNILKRNKKGEITGGYCLHFAIVLMQALQSFGIQARIVNANHADWGGHELTEVWSNDFGKWILMDPNFDTYFADQESGIPFNALELHNIFLQEYYPGEKIDRNDWSREDFVRRVESKEKPQSIVCMVGGGAKGSTLKEYEWWKPVVELYDYCGGYGLLNTGYFRLLPRNNFLSQSYPIPVNHGRTHWGWTGYYTWYDQQTPRAQEFQYFTNRPNDLYWNLNEVDFSAEIKDPGALLITLDTNSPNFDHYELNINETVVKIKEPNYLWKLVQGRNSLIIRVVDVMQNKGSASMLELNFVKSH